MNKIKYLFLTILIFVLSFICFNIDFVSAAPNGGYKLVNFRTKASSAINTEYTEANTGQIGYTNGYYGADALYLGTSGSKIKFMLSGVIGYVEASEVSLYPMETQSDYDKYYMSYYENQGGIIVHKIALKIEGISYGTTYLGKNTVGLIEGKDYLSYDGHYFYPASLAGYKQMTNDILNGNNNNAVNAGNPFYSYYQFLSHRSLTNYTATDINNYVKNVWGYTSTVDDRNNLGSKESLMYGLGSTFINAQNTYGANALLSFSTAANESSRGRSNIALRTNNLFGHGAYDSAPGANANGYNTPADSVNAHARYFVSIDYMDPKDYLSRYNGGQLGNKASGLNVKYASDPYWGEKAATNYYNFDKTYGYQDYGYFTLGIKTRSNSYNIYKEPNTSSNVLYSTEKLNDYSVTILDEVTGTSINGNNKWYKIQTDPVLNDSRTAFVQDVGEYAYSNNYAYIHSSAIDVIVKNGVSQINKTYNITFNANGGKFSDGKSSKVVNVKSGVTPSVENPTKTGYKFSGWSETVKPAASDKTYKANWKINTYDITFDANGGKFSDGNTKRVVKTKYNSLPAIDEPVRDGYIFTGWDKKVVAATAKTTYKATWKAATFYNVTFNADGGTFSNDKEELVVKVAENTIPKVETPIKDGYVFVEWTPELSKVTGPTSYEAVWRKGTIEDYLTKKDGEFYFQYIKEENDKLMFKGYEIIKGIDNDLDKDINYRIVFIDNETGDRFEQSLERIKDAKNHPFEIVNSDYDYKYAWFEGEIDITKLPDATYQIYVIADNGKYYAKDQIKNVFRFDMDGYFESEKNSVYIRNNQETRDDYVELFVRTNSLGTKTATTRYNMSNSYSLIEFKNNKLHVRGTSHIINGDYSKVQKVERYLIFENTKTFEVKKFNIGSITNGDYDVVLRASDGKDKTRAWFDAEIDVNDFEVGTYNIYINTISNLADVDELADIFNNKIKATYEYDDKVYSFVVDKENRYRIQMIVKNK